MKQLHLIISLLIYVLIGVLFWIFDFRVRFVGILLFFAIPIIYFLSMQGFSRKAQIWAAGTTLALWLFIEFVSRYHEGGLWNILNYGQSLVLYLIVGNVMMLAFSIRPDAPPFHRKQRD